MVVAAVLVVGAVQVCLLLGVCSVPVLLGVAVVVEASQGLVLCVEQVAQSAVLVA